MCLACLGNLEEEAVPCSHCGWHFCKLCAQEGARGGHQQECRIFQEAKLKPGDEGSEHLFPIITILRFLLLKIEDNGDKWRQVEKLMDNWDEFKKDASLVEELSKVTNFLKEKMNLDWVDERSVARAYGVMKTNAMSLKDEGGQALFPIASLMSHSCVSNLEPLDEPGITIAFRAKRNIKEGEELTIRYAMFLQPRDQIQEPPLLVHLSQMLPSFRAWNKLLLTPVPLWRLFLLQAESRKRESSLLNVWRQR